MRKISISLACGVMAFAPLVLAHGNCHSGIVASKAANSANTEQYEFGKAGPAQQATRTIHIVMDDKIRFAPSVLSVNAGDVVKFVVTNRGKILPEMVIAHARN